MLSDQAGPRRLRQLLDAVVMVGSDLDLHATLHRITEAAVSLVDAKYGALGVLNEDRSQLADFITVGIDDETIRRIGPRPKGLGLLGSLITNAQPLRLANLSEHPDSAGFPPNHPLMTSFLGVPIRVRNEVFGNLYLTDKQSAEAFTEIDEELVLTLGTAAGIAIENARLYELAKRAERVSVLEDQERIARDLHDTVIQRLFACGLSLQGATRLISDPEARQRVEDAIEELDVTVRHIRTVIFDVGRSTTADDLSLRRRVISVVKEAARVLEFEPRLTFDGPIDNAISATVGEELVASLREALSNVARHAHASETTVEVSVAGGEAVLCVTDNGVGITADAATGGRGLQNLRDRAARAGGSISLVALSGGGTQLEMRLPVASA